MFYHLFIYRIRLEFYLYRFIVYLFLACARSFTFYRFTIIIIIMQVLRLVLPFYPY